MLGIARALWQSWRTGQAIAGTSTLTQQLARNLYLPETKRTEHTLRRKLREAWLAWGLERTYVKDELLALYLNTTYYGHFATGIEAAAQAYFGVHAKNRTSPECALLARAAQSLILYNPIENLEAAESRQGIVLRLMARHVHNLRSGRRGRRRAAGLCRHSLPHRGAALRDVGAGPARNAVGRRPGAPAGGLRVTTTLDVDWQRQAEAIVAVRTAGAAQAVRGRHLP